MDHVDLLSIEPSLPHLSACLVDVIDSELFDSYLDKTLPHVIPCLNGNLVKVRAGLKVALRGVLTQESTLYRKIEQELSGGYIPHVGCISLREIMKRHEIKMAVREGVVYGTGKDLPEYYQKYEDRILRKIVGLLIEVQGREIIRDKIAIYAATLNKKKAGEIIEDSDEFISEVLQDGDIMKMIKAQDSQKLLDVLSPKYKKYIEAKRGGVPDVVNKNIQGIIHAVGESLGHSIYRLGYTKPETRTSTLDVLASIHGLSLDILRSREERLEFARKIAGIDPELVHEYLAVVDAINLKNLIKNQTGNTAKMTYRLRQNLILFFSDYIAGDKEYYGRISDFIHLMADMFSLDDSEIYMSVGNNDIVIMERLWNCMKGGSIDLMILTCPDYSGEMVNGIWKYDFNSLGTGDGVVARKSYDYVIEMHRICNKYMKVKINHCLPSFEFTSTNGFEGKGTDAERLSFLDCMGRLALSLISIGSEYKRRYPDIDLSTSITSSLITDEEFADRKLARAKELIGRIPNDKSLAGYLNYVFNLRKNLYLEWHPSRDVEETPEEFRQRIITTVIPDQVAEYQVIGEILTSGNNTFLLSSDSPVMTESYTDAKIPVLYGKGRNSSDYDG